MGKITACRITELPKKLFDPMPKVMITLEGETKEKELFEYFPDELSFTAEEFIGLTEQEANQLKFKKDQEYLRS